MIAEAVAFGVVLAAALLVLVGLVRRDASTVVRVVACASSVGVALLLSSVVPSRVGEVDVEGRPIAVPDFGYVSSDTCRSCHPGKHETWRASYHRTMTQVAAPDSIVADFDDVTLHLGDFTYRLYREGDDYRVDIEPPPDGFMAFEGATRRKVVMVTGSHHYQVYWLDTPNGRELEQFPLAYLLEERRWVSRAATLIMPPEKFPGVKSGGWNRACIRCHTTNGRPRPGPGDHVDSQVSEFGIACEACHGPGGEHVRRHQGPGGRYLTHLRSEPDPTIVNPRRLTHRRSAEVCGQCHGIFDVKSQDLLTEWFRRGYRYRPGQELSATRTIVRYSRMLEHPVPGRPTPGEQFFRKRFWSDGTIRVIGREYNALLDTPCFTDGTMSCLSCHVLHKSDADGRSLREWADDQLGPGMRGSQACLQCHGEYEEPRALEAHTRHSADGPGSGCYDCHMPYTTYGLLKATRSHTIDSPALTPSLEAGRPNACNMCHLDRSLAWTAEYLERWYGIASPSLTDDHRSTAASLLWLYEGEAGQRALMAWAMGWSPAHRASDAAWIAPHLARLLADPYDAVRIVAGRSLLRLPGFADFQYDPAAETGRGEAVRRAIDLWREQGRPRHASVEASVVLLDDGGTLDEAAVRQHLARRDDRRMWLTE